MKNKKNEDLQRTVIFSICLLFILVMVVAFMITSSPSITGEEYSKYSNNINNRLNELLDEQKKVDKELHTAIDNEEYTLDKAYVKVNPYGISPMSALIIFKTDEVTTIEVYVNDELSTTVEASKSHVIPVYGLLSDANNIVKLVTSDGKEKEYTIAVSAYDFTYGDFDIKKAKGKYKNYFLLGGINRGTSTIRGFDNESNLIYYLELNYISGIKLRSDRFYVKYNQKNSYGKDYNDLKLEIDYLGKILNVSEDTTELNTKSNVTIDSKEYIGYPLNLVKETIDNYEVRDAIGENTKYFKKITHQTISLKDQLTKAKTFDEELDIIPNCNTLTVATKKENVSVLLVSVDRFNTYEYKTINKRIITDLKGEYVVFLKINNEFYTTNTVVTL